MSESALVLHVDFSETASKLRALERRLDLIAIRGRRPVCRCPECETRRAAQETPGAWSPDRDSR